MKQKKKLLSLLLAAVMLLMVFPTSVSAATGLTGRILVDGAKFSSRVIVTVNGETQKGSVKACAPGTEVTIDLSELTLKDSAYELLYVIICKSNTSAPGSDEDFSDAAKLQPLNTEKTQWQFQVPSLTDTNYYYVRIVYGEPPAPTPAPEIHLTSVSGTRVEFESGAATFRSTVIDQISQEEMTEGTVQYYLNGNKIGNPVHYDSARIEKGFYTSISTDQIRDNIALKMGENTVYAVYTNGDLSADSNTVTVTVTKKDISKSGFVSTGIAIDTVYDATDGMGRAQFSVSTQEAWVEKGLGVENLSITAEKDGIPYSLTDGDMTIGSGTSTVLIQLAAPSPGTYKFTAAVNHEFYTGAYVATVTVGKRSLTIKPSDVEINEGETPEYSLSTGSTTLAGEDSVSDVVYRVKDNADISQPGIYTVEIESYTLDNASYYTVTVETGILTVYALADYDAVKEAIAKAQKLDPNNYLDFTGVTEAIEKVDYSKNETEQTEVDAMAQAIEDAIKALEYKGADYSKVDEAIAKASALNKNEYKDFAAVEAAIDAVVRDKNITEQATVDEYAADIENAIKALEYKGADYSKVDEAIAKANALNKDEYKDFSAIEAAINAVVRGKNITEQAEVDAMAKAINDAIASIEKKPDTKPGDPDNPQTGDNSNMWLWLAVMLAAGAGLTGTMVYGRKKKYNG